MNELVLVATNNGVVSCRWDGRNWFATGRGLAGRNVHCVSARADMVLAGTAKGIFRLEKPWFEGIQARLEPWIPAGDGVHSPYIRRLAIYPGEAGYQLAGTEPANIFLSYDDGLSWRSSPEVGQLREQFGWYLPYSPRAGAVRSFAFDGSRVYAAVEVGGVLVSNDSGETWQLAAGSHGRPEHDPPAGFVHPDVHSLEIVPAASGTVYAATGGGLYRSEDQGDRWQRVTSEYCRAVWVDPDDGHHLILGPAEGVDRNGRIDESRDGGRTWQAAMDGLEKPWPHTMVEQWIQANDQLLAILSNGEVLAASLNELTWQPVLRDVGQVNDADVFVENSRRLEGE